MEKVLGAYRLERRLGGGGMGEVHEALHLPSGRRCALKLLHPRHRRDPDLLARFRREAELSRQGDSPHLVRVLDFVAEREAAYLVMELLEGASMGAWLRARGRVTAAELLPVLWQLAEALDPLHARGITHRDLKPDNLFFHDQGLEISLKVLDFGVAKDASVAMTAAATLLGTPAYMAPEQAAGRVDEVGPATDAYAVGAILFRAVTGSLPFQAATPFELFERLMRDPPADVRLGAPELPEGCARAVERLLEKAPGARYKCIADLAGDWQRALPEGATRSLEGLAGFLRQTRVEVDRDADTGGG